MRTPWAPVRALAITAILATMTAQPGGATTLGPPDPRMTGGEIDNGFRLLEALPDAKLEVSTDVRGVIILGAEAYAVDGDHGLSAGVTILDGNRCIKVWRTHVAVYLYDCLKNY